MCTLSGSITSRIYTIHQLFCLPTRSIVLHVLTSIAIDLSTSFVYWYFTMCLLCVYVFSAVISGPSTTGDLLTKHINIIIVSLSI